MADDGAAAARPAARRAGTRTRCRRPLGPRADRRPDAIRRRHGRRVSGPDGTYTLETTYLVGADGGRSTVRKLAGIDFPGPHVQHRSPESLTCGCPTKCAAANGGIDVPGVGPRCPAGTTDSTAADSSTPSSSVSGRWSEPSSSISPRDDSGADDARRAARQRAASRSASICRSSRRLGDGPHALRRIAGQNTRQADRYRAGNIFLVGDSAHVHSAMGGPGLEPGYAGRDEPRLEVGRRGQRLGARGICWTPTKRAVSRRRAGDDALHVPRPPFRSGTRDRRAARTFQGATAATERRRTHGPHLLAGSDVRYDVGDDHPLAGRLAPDLTLDDGRRDQRACFTGARPVLLDLSGGRVGEAARGWADRVDVVVGAIADFEVCAPC